MRIANAVQAQYARIWVNREGGGCRRKEGTVIRTNLPNGMISICLLSPPAWDSLPYHVWQQAVSNAGGLG
jgi:hypothetical protein